MEDIFNMFDISFADQDQTLAVLLAICVCLFVIFFCLGLNREYERSVVFRLGRVLPVKGPGVFWKWPILDRVEHVDLRTVTEALQTQETVSKDGVSVAVNAVMWYRAADPQKIVLNVRDWNRAIVQAAETAVRDAIGQSELDQLLKERSEINRSLLAMMKGKIDSWGIEVEAVEIKNLDLPEAMQRAFAREAESTREARARVIKADGELLASEKLASAANALAASPGALEIRRQQTLTEIGAEHNSTIIALMPTELLQGFSAMAVGRPIAGS